jgi:hypothetical protein
MNRKYVAIWIGIFMAGELCLPFHAEAFLFHATRSAVAKRIMKQGFSKARMRASARFGKGVYVSTKKKTALAEGRGATVIRLKDGKYIKRNSIDLSSPTPAKLKKVSGKQDLRGKVKKGIIDPKLGQKLGQAASERGKAIRYRSARDPKGTNIFIPQNVYQKHPGIVKADRVSGGR